MFSPETPKHLLNVKINVYKGKRSERNGLVKWKRVNTPGPVKINK
jgi:hypothetical protein